MRACILVSIVSALSMGQGPAAAPAQKTGGAATITDRVNKYVRDGGTPVELAILAAEVLLRDQHAGKPEVVTIACFSTSVPAPDCVPALRKIADDARVPMPVRLRAAGGLLVWKDEKAGERFDNLVNTARPDQLAHSVVTLEQVPAANAVPALVRVLEAGDERGAIAAARALGSFQMPAAVNALGTTVANHQPATPVWLAANAARAKLGVPDAIRLAGSTHPYMATEDLLAAGEGFLAAGDERAEPFLLLVTRKGESIPRLRAAALLRSSREPLFQKFLTEALTSTEPAVKAEALRIARQTPQILPRETPPLLLDQDPLVRVRAVELILAWAGGKAP